MRISYEGRQYMRQLQSDLAKAAIERERKRKRKDEPPRHCHSCGFEHTRNRFGGNPDCSECIARHERLKERNREYKRAERARHPKCDELTKYGRVCGARGKVEVLIMGEWIWRCRLHHKRYVREGYEIRTPESGPGRSRTHSSFTDTLAEAMAARERARADVQPGHASNGARTRKSSTDL